MTDPTRIYDDQHNNAPAVPQGWKLVPVEPTRAMWAAVNKLDDEMAAGSYDGKGCSIEQAWNCMLDFAPDAPALAATPAAPEQTVPSVVWIVSNKTSSTVFATEEFAQKFISSFSGSVAGGFSVSRVDVIGARQPATDAGVMAQGVGLTDEEIEAIAKKHMSTVGDHWCNEEAIREIHAEDFARDIIAAIRAKGGK